MFAKGFEFCAVHKIMEKVVMQLFNRILRSVNFTMSIDSIIKIFIYMSTFLF